MNVPISSETLSSLEIHQREIVDTSFQFIVWMFFLEVVSELSGSDLRFGKMSVKTASFRVPGC